MSQSKYRADIDGLWTIALARLSYRFVETPMRHVRAPLGIRVFPVAALAIGLIAAGSLFLVREQGRFYAGTLFDGNDWLPPLHVAYAPDSELTRGATVQPTVPKRCQSGPGAQVFVVDGSHVLQTLIHDDCIHPRARLEQARAPALAVLRDQPGFHMSASASASAALADSLLAQLASLP